ncbi:O-antigen ligase family protein [Mycolicibacterium vanbaalenii]|uniref:O-antigen ligase family protein n=1 Tax=Mycolicibacterium vanbaalenii TaxID=110539 RepID=UPI0023BAAEF3|nr:O-antigen ligase family protein [Mycolicibacterium vanbaalenii]
MTTAIWAAISLLLPINWALPSVVRAIWFVAIAAMLFVPVLFLRVARPLYSGIWIFAGFAALVSVLLTADATALEENLFVGSQIILLLGLGVFTLTYNVVADEYFCNRLGAAFVIGQSLSSFVALAQVMGFAVGVPAQITVDGRVGGLAEHQNTVGIMSTIAILLSMRIAFMSRKYRLLAMAAVSVNLVGLVGSGSLTAVLALALGSIVLVLSMRDNLGKILVWGIPFAAILWLLAMATNVSGYLPSLTDRFRQVTGQSRGLGENTSEIRLQTYDVAWREIVEDPLFGVGLGHRFSEVSTSDGLHMVHNVLLRAWYQGGIFLVVAFALIIIAMLIVVFRAVAHRIYGAEASIFVAVLTYAALSPLLEQRHFWLPALLAWASISANSLKRRHGSIQLLGSALPSRENDR